MSDSSASADPPPSLQQQIDAICDRFEAAIKADASTKIEDFLEDLPGDHSHALLKALIDLEIHHSPGATVTPADYRQRFGSAFDAIEASLFAAEDPTVPPQPAAGGKYEPSRCIGPFKLLQSLGAGGMGEVWMADQQEPVRRRVALKLVKSGMDSKQMLARFEAERQALAMMDHPHIAKVLDAGIGEDGTPYFAMELVKGKPITDYCDRAKLGINERLELFVQVCRAIQHAHQKGILHRDIKPNNVLVTNRDGVPHAKVIDFGLAKAMQDQTHLTDKTLFTQAGQVFGTLEYMSPEQAEASELGLDTRTDVYSLGVLLYELLTGSTPLGRDRVQKEAFHRVLEFVLNEETPRPSRRLSESGDAVTGISEQRKIDPKKLTSLLKGELDWIALKALEKDRDRRYDGAGSFADDVQHFLDGDVVEARPPSAGYRLRKTVRKHKTAFATGTAFLLLLVGALVFNVGVARYALNEADRANVEAQRATEAEQNARTAEKTAGEEAQRARAAEENAIAERDRAETAQEQAVIAQEKAFAEARRATAAEERTAATLARSNYFLANARWNGGRAADAKGILNSIPEEHRHFEWYYTRRQFEGSDQTLTGHEASVTSVCFSPDGTRIASASADETIKLWDAATGEELITLKGHEKAIWSVCFSPDGTLIASGSEDGTIKW